MRSKTDNDRSTNQSLTVMRQHDVATAPNLTLDCGPTRSRSSGRPLGPATGGCLAWTQSRGIQCTFDASITWGVLERCDVGMEKQMIWSSLPLLRCKSLDNCAIETQFDLSIHRWAQTIVLCSTSWGCFPDRRSWVFPEDDGIPLTMTPVTIVPVCAVMTENGTSPMFPLISCRNCPWCAPF